MVPSGNDQLVVEQRSHEPDRGIRRAVDRDLGVPLYLARVRAAAQAAGVEVDSVEIWNLAESGIDSQLERDWERYDIELHQGAVLVHGDAVGIGERRAIRAVTSGIPGVTPLSPNTRPGGRTAY